MFDDRPYFMGLASIASGLAKLQTLAFGDFSYGGRYAEHNKLLCKSEGGFRNLSAHEIPLWELAQRHMDMLEACPLHSFVD